MDLGHLRRAFALAEPTHPHPNPKVGAVVVDVDGAVVGEGWHIGPGQDHAEVVALKAAGSAAVGSVVYVTLEPCAHHGRTPPCVDALISAGVSKVVVAVGDPDLRVAGEGIQRLLDAGIEVVEDALPSEGIALDPGYFHHRETGRPRVTIKVAATLDGNSAAADFSSQWITSEEARADGHRLRAASDGVMVGAGTLIADDPRLDVRIDGFGGPQPRPVVIAGRRSLPRVRHLWEREPLLVATHEMEAPVETIVVGAKADGGVDLTAALGAIGRHGVVDLLVEGGSSLLGSLIRAGLVDRGVLYFGARVGGGAGIPIASGPFPTLAEAAGVTIIDVRMVGPDVRIEFARKDR